MKLLRCGDWSIHIDNKIDYPDARSNLNLRSQSVIWEYRRQGRRSMENVFELACSHRAAGYSAADRRGSTQFGRT